MTLGTYQVRSAYQLKPRKGINKYTPEDFTQRGNRTVSTSRMAALDDYLDDDVDDVEEPEPERILFLGRQRRSPSRGGEEPKSAQGTSHCPLFVMLNLEWW